MHCNIVVNIAPTPRSCIMTSHCLPLNLSNSLFLCLLAFLSICCFAFSFPSSSPRSSYLHGRRTMHAYQAKSVSHGYVIGLKHRDFSSSVNGTLAEKMQLAVRRSGRRLSRYQNSIFAKAAGNVASSTFGFEAPVLAGDGAFLTTLKIGTPGKTFTAILDTGSDLVWQQCKPCQECFTQSDTIFDPSESSTYRKAGCSDSFCQALPLMACSQTCKYTYMYGDSSITSGDLSYDTLTLKDTSGEGHKIANFSFGCGHDNEGISFAGSDGLLGLGQGSLSLTSQLAAKRFSYCLGSFMSSETSPLFLGEAATMDGSEVHVTPLITNPAMPSFYYLNLEGISVNGTRLDIPFGTFALRSDGSGGIFIDSGTTITYLQDEGYYYVRKAFESAMKLPKVSGSDYGLDLCYNSSGEVPRLTFHFEGADMDLPARNTFINFEGYFCLAMGRSSGISILGNIQQQNYHFLFDRAGGKISFTQTSCSRLLPEGLS